MAHDEEDRRVAIAKGLCKKYGIAWTEEAERKARAQAGEVTSEPLHLSLVFNERNISRSCTKSALALACSLGFSPEQFPIVEVWRREDAGVTGRSSSTPRKGIRYVALIGQNKTLVGVVNLNDVFAWAVPLTDTYEGPDILEYVT